MEKNDDDFEQKLKKMLAPPAYDYNHFIKSLPNKRDIIGLNWRLENFKEDNPEIFKNIKKRIKLKNKITMEKKNTKHSKELRLKLYKKRYQKKFKPIRIIRKNQEMSCLLRMEEDLSRQGIKVKKRTENYCKVIGKNMEKEAVVILEEMSNRRRNTRLKEKIVIQKPRELKIENKTNLKSCFKKQNYDKIIIRKSVLERQEEEKEKETEKEIDPKLNKKLEKLQRYTENDKKLKPVNIIESLKKVSFNLDLNKHYGYNCNRRIIK